MVFAFNIPSYRCISNLQITLKLPLSKNSLVVINSCRCQIDWDFTALQTRIPGVTLKECQWRVWARWSSTTVFMHAFFEVLYKKIDFIPRDVWHYYYVSNVLFARKLPSFHECIVDRSFQNHGWTQIIETTRNSRTMQCVTQIFSSFYAMPVDKNRLYKVKGWA